MKTFPSGVDERLMTVREAAAYYRVTEATVHRWCREGRLQAVRVGKSWLIPRPEREASRADGPGQELAGYRNAALDRKVLSSRARGQHIMTVAASDDHAEALIERIRQQAATRHIVALNVRFRTADRDDERRDEVLLPPILESGDNLQLELAWQRSLTPLARQGRVLCLIRQKAPADSASGGAFTHWEESISSSILGGPFTVVCVYADAPFQRMEVDARTRIIAAHSALCLESEHARVLLARS
jgi:excisionase family DNA binding protein